MNRFEVGKKYWTTFNCDEDYFLCVKATDKTATFEIHGKLHRGKIKSSMFDFKRVDIKINGCEYSFISRTKKEKDAIDAYLDRQAKEGEKDFDRRLKAGTLPPMCVFTGL